LAGQGKRSRAAVILIPGVAMVAALLASGGPPGAAGAIPAGLPIQGAERAQVLDRLRERQRDLTSVRATVVQRKRHPLLKAEAVSEGTFCFQRPNRMRWEVIRPERAIIAIDGFTLVTYRPDRNEAERRDLRDDFATRAAVEFFTMGLSLPTVELEQRFQVDLYRESGRLVLLLTPRSRWLAQAVASISVSQSDQDAVPRQIVVVGRKGERTETTLTHVVANVPSAEDACALRLGPEVHVTDVRKAASETGSDR
jgi:outer membrane lipoprotein-sorting protein